MSPDPEELAAPKDGAPLEPERDEALVARLRAMRWPQADAETKERALERFLKLVDLPEPTEESRD